MFKQISRLFLFVCLGLGLSTGIAHAASTPVALSGTVLNTSGSVVPSAKLIWIVMNCKSTPKLDGQILISPFLKTADPHGVLSGTIPGTPDISCGNVAYYEVWAYTSSGSVIWTHTYETVGSTFNLNTAPLLTTPPSSGPGSPDSPGGTVGPAGPQGATGPAGAAGLGFTFRGAWVASTAYSARDIVTNGGSTYEAPSSFTSSSTFSADSSHWSLWASVGATGAAGTAGAAGAQGPAGSAGATGPQGLQGNSGGSTTWLGAWSSLTSYVLDNAVSFNGSSYIAIASNTNITPGTNPSDWQLLAQAGAAGATGPQGATGTQGSTGTQGAAGATGTAGAAATVAIGSVSTLAAGASATAVNVGTSNAAIFNLGIPQGIAGSAGVGAALAANNLSDLTSISTARTNLGLGSAALSANSAFDASGAASTAQTAAIAAAASAGLQKTSNLSDLANAVTARTNLGLGTAATTASTAYDAAGAAATAQAAAIASAIATAANANNITSGTVAPARLGTNSTGGATAFLNATGAFSIPAGSGGGLADPTANGLVFRTALNTTAPATAAQVQAVLALDTVNNTAVGFHAGSGGDTTCPTPISGADYFCFKSGFLNYSHSGSAYVQFINGSILTPAVAAQTDGATVTWAVGSAILADASLTLVHTTSTRALNFTGLAAGGTYLYTLKQDATGGAAATLGTGCTWLQAPSGAGYTALTTLALTTTANAVNLLGFYYDGTNCYGNLK